MTVRVPGREWRRRYTAQELERIVPFDVIMTSGVLAMARRRGLRKGLRKGLREGLREVNEAVRPLCLGMVGKHHPEPLARVTPAREARNKLEALTSWTLLASEGDCGSLLAVIGSSPSPAEARVAAGRSTGRSTRMGSSREVAALIFPPVRTSPDTRPDYPPGP